MCKIFTFLTIMTLSLIFAPHNYAQDIRSEASYYAPIRYVIVYNSLFLDGDERRVDVLMDEKQFNEDNLKTVFELVNKRFPAPSRLAITVHTNLATIETPEEDEMSADSIDSRFGNINFNYKKAFFMRFENGRKAFNYTINLHPGYREKLVLISEGSKPLF